MRSPHPLKMIPTKTHAVYCKQCKVLLMKMGKLNAFSVPTGKQLSMFTRSTCTCTGVAIAEKEDETELYITWYGKQKLAKKWNLTSIGVWAHSDLGGRRSSCPKKLHNARMCER